MSFYDSTNLLKNNSTYNVVVGQRSNGKTFNFVDDALDSFIKNGIPSVYVRRYSEDLTAKNIFKLCDSHINTLQLLTDDYNCFVYSSHVFYLAYKNDNGKIEKMSEPFLYCYSLNTWEHQKGQDIGDIYYIIFDEFVTRKKYIENEYEIFMNVLSTIIRYRTNTKIIMIANTISKYCPYFDHFKIDIHKIKQGTITNYRYGETTLSFEYCSQCDVTSKTNKKYFDFPNKTLQSLKTGVWEIDDYNCVQQYYYKQSDKLTKIYVCFSNKCFCWELLRYKDNMYSFVYPYDINKLDYDNYFVVTNDFEKIMQYQKSVMKIRNNKIFKILYETYADGKIGYSNDDMGDMFENWLMTA